MQIRVKISELMSHIFHPQFFKHLIIACAILSGIATLYFSFTYYYARRKITNTAIEKATTETKKAAKEIDSFMSLLKPLVSSIVDELGTGAIAKDQAVNRIKQKAVNITGIGIAYAPFAYDEKIRLFAPYYVERNGRQQLVQLETYYDYTQPGHPRYTEPISKKMGMFLEPFFDEASGSLVAEYASPFLDLNLQPQGVVFANHSTEHIQYILRNLELGRSGYGAVISSTGKFVAHPNQDLVRQGRGLFEPESATNVKTKNDFALEKVAKEAIEGKSTYFEQINGVTGQKSWMFFEPIPSAKWVVVGIFAETEVELNTVALKHNLIRIILCLLAFFIFLGFLLFKIYTGESKNLWHGSLWYSFCILLAIIFMWYIARVSTSFQTAEDQDTFIIQDSASLKRYLDTHAPKENIIEEPVTAAEVQEQAEQVTTPKTAEETKTAAAKPAPKTPPAQPVAAAQGMEHMHHIDTINAHIDSAKIQTIDQLTEQLKKVTKTISQTNAQLRGSLAPSSAASLAPAAAPASQAGHSMHGKGGAAESKVNLALQVPTGIYLHQLAFTSANKIEFIAHVWQKYLLGTHDNIERGVVFPEAGTYSDVKEAYRFTSGNWETIGYSAKCTLEQNFSFENYPFDAKNVYILMWPKDFDKGIVLVPDLSAYKVINPTSLPGISKDIEIPNWHIEKSYFSFRIMRFLTNFGYYIEGPFGSIERSTKSQTPALYFNVILDRYILSSLILNLFPVIIIMILLFILLAMASRGILRFEHILASAASFFFTTIIAHTKFKTDLPVQGIVFFEFFYFLLEFFILAVTILSIVYFLKLPVKFISYNEMEIPRLLYWPLAMTSTLIISLIYFY